MKWGEHASDVQFILQRTSLETQPCKNNVKNASYNSGEVNNPPPATEETFQASESPVYDKSPSQRPLSPNILANRDIKKSLTFSGGAPRSGGESRRLQQVGSEVVPLSPVY